MITGRESALTRMRRRPRNAAYNNCKQADELHAAAVTPRHPTDSTRSLVKMILQDDIIVITTIKDEREVQRH